MRRHSCATLTWLLAGFAALVPPASGSSGGGGTGPSGGGGSGPIVIPAPPPASIRSNPFAARGMWIWYVSASNGGNLSSIVSTAHRYGVRTLTIKSGDGTGVWSQFGPQLVSTLHANGLRVCGWQYVYGTHPILEAQVGAAAVREGADCLVIDAESEYEGKYIQAQAYVTQLRKLIGQSFPVALAGFPYIDYHPGFPYSIFLGPGGAQYNTPQMYWVDIGTSVDTVYAHTYAYNRLYGRQIDPLGQVYNNPPVRQIIRFRQISRAYGAAGLSWWDWQEATSAGWRALARPAASLAGYAAGTALAICRRGDRGDLVVWAQEHLLAAGERIAVSGMFGANTQSAVQSFQLAHGLSVDGVVGPLTWQALLRYAPAKVVWTHAGAHAARASAFSLTMPVPQSARLHARRDEIRSSIAAGRRPKR